MIPVWLFLALRYIQRGDKNKSIHIIAKLSCISIAVATFCLALITSIMSGFEKSTYDKFQTLHADIIMQQYGVTRNLDAIESCIKQEFPEIIGISPYSTGHGIIYNQDDDQTNSIIIIKGIIPEYEAKTTRFFSTIIEHIPTIKKTDILNKQSTIVIGAKLAENLGVSVGDTVSLLYTPHFINNIANLNLEIEQAEITGIFKSGVEEFDDSVVYCSLDFLQTLFPETTLESIGLKCSPESNEHELIRKLSARFDAPVQSWKDLYPSLVAALKLEKYAVFFIVALLLLMACVSITCLVYLQLYIKQTDIAVLQACGMGFGHLKALFFCLTGILTFIGSIIGLVSAFLVGIALQKFNVITLPDSYIVTHLPLCMQWQVFVAIFILSMILCFGATWLPLRRIQNVTIALTLKYR